VRDTRWNDERVPPRASAFKDGMITSGATKPVSDGDGIER
jgi:hypothetical protein